MTDKVSVHCYVSGRVQGVWFRASTQHEAKKLGVTGWVRNLPDGRVEAMISGERVAVAKLCEWLKQGPEQAQVSEVIQEEVLFREFDRFGVM